MLVLHSHLISLYFSSTNRVEYMCIYLLVVGIVLWRTLQVTMNKSTLQVKSIDRSKAMSPRTSGMHVSLATVSWRSASFSAWSFSDSWLLLSWVDFFSKEPVLRRMFMMSLKCLNSKSERNYFMLHSIYHLHAFNFDV